MGYWTSYTNSVYRPRKFLAKFQNEWQGSGHTTPKYGTRACWTFWVGGFWGNGHRRLTLTFSLSLSTETDLKPSHEWCPPCTWGGGSLFLKTKGISEESKHTGVRGFPVSSIHLTLLNLSYFSTAVHSSSVLAKTLWSVPLDLHFLIKIPVSCKIYIKCTCILISY